MEIENPEILEELIEEHGKECSIVHSMGYDRHIAECIGEIEKHLSKLENLTQEQKQAVVGIVHSLGYKSRMIERGGTDSGCLIDILREYLKRTYSENQ